MQIKIILYKNLFYNFQRETMELWIYTEVKLNTDFKLLEKNVKGKNIFFLCFKK